MLGKRLLIMSFAWVGCVFNLIAQPAISSYTIRAQAMVVDKAEIEMVTIKNLEIDESMAQNGIINVSAQKDPKAGMAMLLGKSGAHFRVQFNPKRVIVNTMGEGALVINYKLFGFHTNLQFASEPIDAAENILIISNKGEYYFWIGGIIDISKASPGNYQGEFTIEIEYL